MSEWRLMSRKAGDKYWYDQNGDKVSKELSDWLNNYQDELMRLTVSGISFDRPKLLVDMGKVDVKPEDAQDPVNLFDAKELANNHGMGSDCDE